MFLEGLWYAEGTARSDTQILDAVQVVALFNYYTRLADALGVEPEDFMLPH